MMSQGQVNQLCESDAYPTVESTPETKGAFLSDYPAMLTIKVVAEIAGLHL